MGQHLMSRPPKYVHGFIDRHGKPRFYFRKAGFKKMPLPGLPWSPAFMEAYEMAIGGAALDIGARRTHPGTINALVVTYFKSAKWEQLSPDTKRMHRRVIERFRAENGDKRVALLHEVHIRKRLDAIPGLSSKRQWLTAIRALLEAAVPTMRADNPTAGIARIKIPPSPGHHDWSDEEIEQYRKHWPLGTQQRLVMEFALEATWRDCQVRPAACEARLDSYSAHPRQQGCGHPDVAGVEGRMRGHAQGASDLHRDRPGAAAVEGRAQH